MPTPRAPMHKSITPRRVEAAARRQMFGTDNPDFCRACGREAKGVEPDARRYKCESCGRREVDGAVELLMELC